MVDLSFDIADLVPDTERPVDTRTPEQVAADEAAKAIVRAGWQAKADAERAMAEAARLARAELEASGARRPIAPWPQPAGMDEATWRLLATARAEHSEWAYEAEGITDQESGDYLEPLLATGWPWYPQSRNGKQRKPLLNKVVAGTKALADGPFPADTQRDLVFRLKRHPFGNRNHRHRERRTYTWQGQWLHSTAVALYSGHRGMWWLDMDVLRPEWVAAVHRLAVEHLGPTPFRRGRYDSPKQAWGYRMAPGEPLPRNRVLKLLTGETRLSDKGVEVPVSEDVEIKAQGQSITILGRHHSGVPYSWDDRIPGLDGSTPDDLPPVTTAQVEAFIAAFEAEFADVMPARTRSAGARTEYTLSGADACGLRGTTCAVPDDDRARWQVTDGLVTDGRGAWGYHHLRRLIRLNAADLAAIVAERGEGAAQDALLARYEMDLPTHVAGDGHYSLRQMYERARDGEVANAWAWQWPRCQGWLPTIETRDDGTGVLVEGAAAPSVEPTTPAEAKASGDEDLSGLLHGSKPKSIKGIVRSAPDAAKAAARARPTDRRQIEEHVATVLVSGIGDFFRRARAENQLLMILKLPTGSGKTSRLIRFIADLVAAGELGKPVGILMPSHGLIEAQRERVQTEAERIAGGMAEADKAGLRAMTYMGRIHHCNERFKPIMAALQAKGLGTSGMCMGETSDGEPTYCPFYATCGATLQKARIAQSHIVFLPSAYLTTTIPKELSEGLSCVVVDEACHDVLIGVSHVTPSTLDLGRKMPKLRREEIKAARKGGRDFTDVAMDLVNDRDYANALIKRAIAAGWHDDIPGYIAGLDPDRENGGRPLRTLFESARRICSDATLANVTPHTTLEGAKAIRTGTEVWPEWHLHDVIIDRLDALLVRRLHDRAASLGSDVALPRAAARGLRDMRLQVLKLGTREDGSRYVTDETRIRVSFRRKPNWGDTPVLLMDASADADVTAKLWPGRTPEVVEVRAEDARPHLRVLWLPETVRSDRSLLPYKPDAFEEASASAASLAQVRALAEGMCAYYAKGRVLMCSTMAVRIATLSAWAGPANLDTGHHGALVGLDHFKSHSALVVVGRNEPPVSAVDAMAGALTYDDDEPELPYDLRGDGYARDEAGDYVRLHYPQEERTVAMADGSDVTYGVPTHPGKWGRKVQWLAREEANSQAIGRLRPVYKDGAALAPLVVIAGRSLPEGTIVDAISTMADVNAALRNYRTLRRDDLGFAADLQSIGVMTEPTPTNAARTVQGWPAVRYRALDRWSYVDSTGKPRTGRVLGNDTDPMSRIAAYEAAAGRGAPRDMALVQAGMPSTLATARPADLRMEALVGTRAERARLAEALAAKAAAQADAFKKAATGRSGYARDFDVDAAMAWVANPFRPRGETHLRDLECLDPEAHAAALADMVIEGECVEPEDVALPAPRTVEEDLADMEAAGVDLGDALLAA